MIFFGLYIFFSTGIGLAYYLVNTHIKDFLHLSFELQIAQKLFLVCMIFIQIIGLFFIIHIMFSSEKTTLDYTKEVQKVYY